MCVFKVKSPLGFVSHRASTSDAFGKRLTETVTHFSNHTVHWIFPTTSSSFKCWSWEPKFVMFEANRPFPRKSVSWLQTCIQRGYRPQSPWASPCRTRVPPFHWIGRVLAPRKEKPCSPLPSDTAFREQIQFRICELGFFFFFLSHSELKGSESQWQKL